MERLVLVHGSVVGAGTTWAAQRPLAERFELVAVERPGFLPGPPVERVDITIPPPPSQAGAAAGAATPEALARGREWLMRAADKAGGVAAWSTIKSWSEDSKISVSMGGQSIALEASQSFLLPDRSYMTQKTPMGEIAIGFDGKAGWANVMGRVQDDPTAPRKRKEDFERSFFRLFQHPEQLEAQALEPRTIDGASYAAAFLKSDVVRDWVVMFDADGRIARMEYSGEGPEGLFFQLA